MAVQMIRQVSCDEHNTDATKGKCKPDTVASVPFRDPLTGDPRIKEICEVGKAAFEAALKVLAKGTREDEEEMKRLADEKAEELREAIASAKTSKSKGGGTVNGETEADRYAPMIECGKGFVKFTTGTGLKGRPGPGHDAIKAFLKTPLGQVWADWKPGDEIPELWKGWKPGDPMPAVPTA